MKPTESRIKDVSFIVNVGTKGDFAKPDSNVVAGKPSSQDPDTWEASLPVPKGATGKLIVSARATSGVGLAGFAHVEIAVKEPVPDPAQADGKPAVEKPGAIEGKVTENNIAQPGLMVYLIDPKAKEKENPVKGQAKTTSEGLYSFTDLKPGPYRVYCLKEATNRRSSRSLGRVGQDTAARPRSAASVSATWPIAAMRQDSRAGKKRWVRDSQIHALRSFSSGGRLVLGVRLHSLVRHRMERQRVQSRLAVRRRLGHGGRLHAS